MNINEIIYHKMINKTTPEEEAVFSQWLNESPTHQKMFDEMLNHEQFSDTYKTYSKLDIEAAWEKIIKKKEKENTFHMTIPRSIFKYAVIILVLLIAGASFWYSQYTKVIPPEISESVKHAMEQSVQSGKQEAVIEDNLLTLWTGKREDVDWVEANGKNRSSAELSEAEHALTKEQLITAKRITTKHDKEFWVTLDDGSLVHLNYNTRIIYPERFGKGNRNVILEGEAYFMIAKDKSRPFIVHTPNGEIKVYGTEFNVNTMHEDASTSVVLVKGSIGITPKGGKERMMKPGEEATFNVQTSFFTIQPVNVDPYIAWNTGDFFFHEWTLQQIMDVMAKWYNVSVEFSDEEVSGKKLNGVFSRYSDIQEIMETIKIVTGFSITINNHHIIIKKQANE
ncbi:MAG: FecR domain-containing protein [Prevotella sp.]|nr:FecR domain-containing protein [Prevotella sp.]